MDSFRKMFPQLEQTLYGKPLVYLDNAATSLRPQSVVDKWTELSLRRNANVHRAVHHFSNLATEEFEKARDIVKDFINAPYREEIIFTKGATDALNLVAFSFGETFVGKGDNVLVTEAEHHSNFVPWQQLCKRKGAEFRVVKVKDNGELDLDDLQSKLDSRSRIACVAHISNVLGITNPTKEIANICHSVGCKLLSDGSQGIVHGQADVQDLGCDFYVFSGHKIYAATGTGILYGKKELLEEMVPYQTGGEMIESVSIAESTWSKLPFKFEAGTPNFSSVPTLIPAIETARLMGSHASYTNLRQIRSKVMSYISSRPEIRLYGIPENMDDKAALFSISVNGAHHEDLALILDKMGIEVRSGQMCAEPLMTRFGVTGMLRASFAPYNTADEAEYFIECLDRAISMLK